MKRRLKGSVRVTAAGTATSVTVKYRYFDLPKAENLALKKRVKASWRAASKAAMEKSLRRFQRERKREEKARRDLAKAAAIERDRRERLKTICLPDRSGETI